MNVMKIIKLILGIMAFVIALVGLFVDVSFAYLAIITSCSLLSIGLIADGIAKEKIVQPQVSVQQPVVQQPIIPVMQQPIPVPQPPKPKFICSICRKEYKNKKELANHLIDDHMNDL